MGDMIEAKMYQFPIGKGKKEFISIFKDMDSREYQFPIGKGKEVDEEVDDDRLIVVSIPNRER